MLLRRRPRRLRKTPFIRALVAENHVRRSDLIWPLFVHDGTGSQEIATMPGVSRLDSDGLLAACQEASLLGLPAVALFPCVPADLRTEDGREAANEQGLIQRCVRRIKRELPNLGVIVDVALDPYTTHGHDGVLDDQGEVANDRTVVLLKAQALSLAAAGADVLAPSDMMDGRIGAIRDALESNGFTATVLLSYAVKYASNLYAPFREAVASGPRLKGNKRGYQMDFANRQEAVREVELDLAEGADLVMVKPGLPYLDVIRELSTTFSAPILAYQVSGEYAMIETAVRSWAGADLIMESLLAFKRAGATAVLSYYAATIAQALLED